MPPCRFSVLDESHISVRQEPPGQTDHVYLGTGLLQIDSYFLIFTNGNERSPMGVGQVESDRRILRQKWFPLGSFLNCQRVRATSAIAAQDYPQSGMGHDELITMQLGHQPLCSCSFLVRQ